MTSTDNRLRDRLLLVADACRQHPWISLVARVLAATAGKPSAETLPLLLALCLLANPRTGRVLAEKDRLADLLGISGKELERRLHALEQRHLILGKPYGTYLVIKVPMWSGRTTLDAAEPAENRRFSPPSTPPPGILPSASAHEKTLEEGPSAESEAEEHRAEQSPGEGVRGPGSGEEDVAWLEHFLDRLIAVIGHPQERASYRTFCARYPRAILDAALHRVAKTPAGRIRRSSGALFIHIVKNHPFNIHDRSSHP